MYDRVLTSHWDALRVLERGLSLVPSVRSGSARRACLRYIRFPAAVGYPWDSLLFMGLPFSLFFCTLLEAPSSRISLGVPLALGC